MDKVKTVADKKGQTLQGHDSAANIRDGANPATGWSASGPRATSLAVGRRNSSRCFLAESAVLAMFLLLALPPGFGQKKPAQPQASAQGTRERLVANAHALESRGRPDMAIQIWQQILLSDPKNAEALAGLARDFKLSGNLTQADATLEKLRAVNPSDPNIARIQALASTRAQSDRLRQAGNLARQGHNEEAMKIYRELYGDRPPDGDIALAFYQTMYGTNGGKDAA